MVSAEKKQKSNLLKQLRKFNFEFLSRTEACVINLECEPANLLYATPFPLDCWVKAKRGKCVCVGQGGVVHRLTS